MKMGPDGTMHMEAQRMTMAKFAEMLSRFAGRPVVDMTGLQGNYQISLDLSMQDMQSAARASGMAGPGMMGPGIAAPGMAPSGSNPRPPMQRPIHRAVPSSPACSNSASGLNRRIGWTPLWSITWKRARLKISVC
jgi:hypothetical protein